MTPVGETTTPDRSERDRITDELDTTQFVQAGAGSGKTTALVNRVLALVGTGAAELSNIAAITFTEKAATELRDRLRHELERVLAAGSEGELVDRYRLGLDQLDGAAIGTLHSFAQRILSEHPIEAGLPPRVLVIDEVSSDVAFERRWRELRDELLADPAYQRTILLMEAAGVRFDNLRMVAAAFNDNWDLVSERVPEDAPEPPDALPLLEPALRELDRLCSESCSDEEDSLRLCLDRIADYVTELRSYSDELDLLEALNPRHQPSFKVRTRGRKPNWSVDLKTFREQVCEAGERLEGIRNEVAGACVEQLGTALRRFTLGAADERRKAGELEFHDLLVRARMLFRDQRHGAEVRSRLHTRYRRLLLDEFQDTDPIQVELAVLIAADDPRLDGQGGLSIPWSEVDVEEGHLFFVGDPKQSIYRFRRADISMFLDAATRFGKEVGSSVTLTANFRSAAPIIDWVNSTFARLVDVADDIDLPVPSQPDYVALESVRPAPPRGPAVARIGGAEHPKAITADDLRELEAADVVAAVTQAIEDGWSVDDGDRGWRPARLGDITILVPSRTSLPFLEDALDRVRIPYRAESNSLVYSSRAVRDLLMVLRSVADPTNQLHLVAALRTPLFACGDDDLFRFRSERDGRWSYLNNQPDSVPEDDPVRMGLGYLRLLYDDRHWLTPAELLDRIARDRRAMDLGFAEGRPATSGGGCGSSSTRRERGTRRPAAICVSTCGGSTCRLRKGRGSPRRSFPKPTTTRFGS